LREAIEELSKGDTYGLKLNLNAIVLRSIKSLKGLYAERMEDAKSVETDMFCDAYNFRSHEMFASARYSVVAQSMNKSRRPATLLEEADIQQLKEFVTRELCLWDE